MIKRRKKITLMPLIALATLSLVVTVPTLSAVHLHAATPQRYTTVTVHPGDTLWSIAAAHTGSGNIQERIDRISDVNHLAAVTLQPGEHLRIPE